MARLSEYNESYVEKAKSYLLSCEDKEDNIVSQESEKYTMYKQKLRVNLPTIEGLAYYLEIHRDTVYDWEQKYPEFSDIINALRGKQTERLINMGLSGDYNPIIAKLLLHKHGYTDKQEIDQKTEHSGQISVTWEEPKVPDSQG